MRITTQPEQSIYSNVILIANDVTGKSAFAVGLDSVTDDTIQGDTLLGNGAKTYTIQVSTFSSGSLLTARLIGVIL